jgi:hypothetical protein
LPLSHSEELAPHERAVRLAEQLVAEAPSGLRGILELFQGLWPHMITKIIIARVQSPPFGGMSFGEPDSFRVKRPVVRCFDFTKGRELCMQLF